MDVFSVCDAYESGVGHGIKRDGLPSPYCHDSNEHEAYNTGYEFGKEKFIKSVREGDEFEEHY